MSGIEPLLKRLLDDMPFSVSEIGILISTAPNRYKDHYIEKRHGRGKRMISQPTAEVKFMQRYLVRNELAFLELHKSAVGYRRGLSIKAHAQPHAASRYLMKLDFKDFFPSISSLAFKERIRATEKYSDHEIDILCSLLFRRSGADLRLSIGAPSSPFISNYVMFEFDDRVFKMCNSVGVEYTRYADDMAFSTSTPGLLDKIKYEVMGILDDLPYLSLSLNESKTVNVSRKNNRNLVGLVLSNQGRVSIGRDAKRVLRAKMHARNLGQMSADEKSSLRGLFAQVHSIDPEFVAGILRKYELCKISDI